MTVVNKKEPILLGIGDTVLLIMSLLAALVLRYQSIPTLETVQFNIVPFAIVFVFSIVIFYVFGLYSRSLSLVRYSLPGKIFKAQIVNGLIASAMFYFVPSFGVSPKTILFIYIGLSTIFILFWRINTNTIFSLRKKQPALVIGGGAEINELVSEMNGNPQSSIYCKNQIDPTQPSSELIKILNNESDFRYVIADIDDSKVEVLLPEIYNSLFPSASVINSHDLYEEVFDKIPLSRINYVWIMSHISSISPKVYDFGKRLTDIILATIVALFALLFYPFVALAIKLEDGGPVLISQFRIGKDNHLFPIYKYRSMTRSDGGQWLPENENKVTRVGKFIRKSRIDELPQAIAVLKGDMSLIGPRADIIDLGKRLKQEIPYYTIRTVIKPGLSGWAQVNQEKPPQSVEETKVRLSYDLYYIKNRSLSLDLLIALKTLKTLLSREGM